VMRDAGEPSLKDQVEGHVTCGWCSTRYESRPDSANCESCGGVLPMPPGNDPGPEPPPAPRQLPRQFTRNLFGKQNLGGWIGMAGVVISLPLVILATCVGVPMLLISLLTAVSNFIAAYRRCVALRHGQPVLGKVESVHQFGERESKHHGSTMYRVYFRFEVNGEPLQGMKYTYDDAILNHFVGMPIWVVYLANKPKYCAIWPPLA